ncbi:hypothetical protein G9F73_005420 [Clostridium estertheticum]|uniref:DUF6544 family protein n=1 Tax=Clostridium estertheticum TaxID=238834 RepID=UPI0013EEBB7D|nr:DUF6544 family protein [Clostridium estertheticum]MBZ9607264.1 hypothetical protein [Clostridium estertheticum]
MKRGKKIIIWILAVIALFILGVLIWFKIPYSPIKSNFSKLTNYQIANMKTQNGIFTTEDISKLPSPVQKYFKYCGYIGTPKMSNMKAYYYDVDFVLLGKPKLKIKYTHYNFVDKPERIALVDTSMFGIPFEGIDKYQDGIGSMKGVIGKAITLFNEKGEGMDKSCLVTYLAEGLLMPNSFLQDFINWEEIDENHAKATITYYGISASGIFAFDDNGAITSFTTDDRSYSDVNGNIQKVKWSAVCEEYKDMNGIKHPTTLKAIWHLETGDFIYFDSRNIAVKYNVTK